jgi:putative ABC transport system permease protein
LTFSISLPGVRYEAPVATARFLQRLEDRIATLPGVESVGTVWPLPLEGQLWAGPYAPLGGAEEESLPLGDYRVITPDYPATIGARLLEGRLFRETDEDHVVLIDQNMAQLLWPESTAVGRRLVAAPVDELQEFEVVGVLETIRHADLKADGRETIYFPAKAWSWSDWELCPVVRTATDPLSLIGPIRDALRSLDPELPMAKARTMNDYVAVSLAPNQFGLVLITIFAFAALVLAMVGLYGVLAYLFTQRTREIGIRMALGARRGNVFGLIVGQGLILTLLGVVVGTVGSLGLAELLSSMLFGVPARDPLTYGAIVLLLVGVALLACFIPAVRATRVDPIVALRVG